MTKTEHGEQKSAASLQESPRRDSFGKEGGLDFEGEYRHAESEA